MTNSKSIVRHLKQKRLQLVPAIGLMILATVGYLNAPKNVQPYLFGAYTLALGFGFGMPSNRLIKAVEEDLQDYEHEIISHFETRLKSAETALKSASEGKESAGTAIAKLQSDLNAANVKNNELAATARAALSKLETLKADSAKIIQTAKQQTKTSVDAAKAEAEAQVKKATEALKIHFAETLERRVLEGREELEKQEYAKSLARIKKYRTEHKQRELQLYTALVETETSKEGLEQQFNQKVEAIVEKYDALIRQYEDVLGSYHPELESIKSSFTQQLQSANEERDRLYAQLDKLNDSKRFNGSSKADHNGNHLIDFYLTRGITLDADRCVPHSNFDEIWVRPRNATPDDLKRHADELHLVFQLVEKPSVEIDRGSIKFCLTQLKENTKPTIKNPSEDWLYEVLLETNHVRVCGATDGGKSTLLDNIFNAYKLLHKDEFNLTLLDPKFPFTPWQDIKPKYQGFDQCLDGMEELGTEIDRRFEIATNAVNSGQELPDFEPAIYAIDELEMLVDDARDKDGGQQKGKTSMRLAGLLRKGLKLGRGLTKNKGKGLIVAYIAQSPLSSRINLNRDDFDQSTNFWIGDTIAQALEVELDKKLSTKQMAELKQQLDLRRDAKEEFFCLVRTPKRVFLATMPKPGYYAEKAKSEAMPVKVEVCASTQTAHTPHPNTHIDSSDLAHSTLTAHKPDLQPTIAPSCSHCGSSKVTKNGSLRGVKRYKCKDCNKSFT